MLRWCYSPCVRACVCVCARARVCVCACPRSVRTASAHVCMCVRARVRACFKLCVRVQSDGLTVREVALRTADVQEKPFQKFPAIAELAGDQHAHAHARTRTHARAHARARAQVTTVLRAQLAVRVPPPHFPVSQ